ncbi:MAG: helix-turn-helix transcriptional regulator [Clostridia bacterium]|nr:helix-turn-helix transcriptional regulator [Clostridia bacterium]
MYRVISIGSRSSAKQGSGYHQHTMWEFVYYTDGFGTVTSGNNEYAFHPNFLICHPPHTPHSECMDVSFSNIYILLDIGDQLSPHTFVYQDPDMREVECIFKQLRYHFNRRGDNWKAINHALIALLLELLRAKPTVDSTEAFVDTAIIAIINGLTDRSFDINSIYKSIPMSHVYFNSLFKRSTGMTPLEYLTHKRIENAKNLLLQRGEINCTVGSIAEMCGYDDIYYFSRVFKKITGLSPLNWLKANPPEQ